MLNTFTYTMYTDVQHPAYINVHVYTLQATTARREVGRDGEPLALETAL